MNAQAAPAMSPQMSRPAAAGSVRTVDAQTARQWLTAGRATLVDVREPDEHAREHIAGAVLMPLSSFDPATAAALPGTQIVFHCRSGSRSQQAARMAAAAARPDVAVYSMDGGIQAWQKASLPVEVNTRAARLSIMRQVQLTVGVGVLAGAALAWFVHPGFIAIPAFFGAGLTFAGATGTCGLAAILGLMPWNRAASCPTKS